MAKKLYEERNIQDIADAIREKTGETRKDDVLVDCYVFKTNNMDSFDSSIEVESSYIEDTFTIRGATKIVFKYCSKYVWGKSIEDTLIVNGTQYTGVGHTSTIIRELEVEGNSITIKFSISGSPRWTGLYSEIRGYDADGNLIQVPSGEVIEIPNTFKVSNMGNAIRGIVAGVELPEEAYVISGSCSWRWSSPDGNWYFDALGDKLTSKDINNLSYIFNGNNKLVRVPCTLNIKNCYNFSSAFSGCSALEECPKIRGNITWSTSTDMSTMVSNCRKIRNFEDLFEPDMLDGFNTIKVTGAYSCAKALVFNDCHSLRTVPTWFYKFKLNEDSTSYPTVYAGYNIYCSAFQYCYSLDEVLNMPVWKCNAAQTSNMFSSTFNYCYRLKNFTFETQPDGTPYTTEWKSQTIDLSSYVGYTNSASNITGSNAGITADKQVINIDHYEALKDDPDWFTADIAFAKYNHDSAVATINSLPDTSAYLATAGGTNTIKFKGTAGSATDGGTINTLTAEEIAVATAKGWTVTLV